MNDNLVFDSKFCSVQYIEKDQVVLLSWKKFACSNNYREPILFALDLLRQYPKSNFVVDAKNGFEDDSKDMEWGFSQLLPNMAKTSCKYVVFIMEKVTSIEEEMDKWTREFGKYFAVIKVESYEQAVCKMKERFLVNVRYTIKTGKWDEFFRKLGEQGIIQASREEPGNYKYEYYVPVDSENDLFLLEMWVNAKAQETHGNTEHYGKLQTLKTEYVTAVAIEKYTISSIS